MPIVSKGLSRRKKHEIIRTIFWVIVVVLNILLLGMLSAMVLVILYPDIAESFMHYTGEKDKPELIKLIGLGMGGIIATLGVFGLLRRATALDKQNEMTAKGNVQERFRAAIEHLGNKSPSIRIASFYEFHRLAKAESYLREHVFDILCAHLRQTTADYDYQKKRELDTTKLKIIKPTEEVQSLLDILFKQRNKHNLIFSGMEANLERAYLKGANLQWAILQNAQLKHVNLQWASLNWANLQNAQLWWADLQSASIKKANLQNAQLWDAQIDKSTTMPDGWKDIVEKDTDGKTGVLLIEEDKGEIIERL